jgi:hypothetical protein
MNSNRSKEVPDMQRSTNLTGCGELLTLQQASEKIEAGGSWTVAADASLLSKLPKGNWIGGTIPYFMAKHGGVSSRSGLFLTEVASFDNQPYIRHYDAKSISNICVDAPENGYTLLIVPAFSEVHSEYARNAPNFEDMFGKPLVGWVSGVHLDDLESDVPATIDGRVGELNKGNAIAMHVPLPEGIYASVDILNGLVQGDGDRIRFNTTGFEVTECLINDIPANFADYMESIEADLSLPLVADYCGAAINVSFKAVDTAKRRVEFYAPVFEGIEYRIAAPPGNLPKIGSDEGSDACFSCNCVLNYIYGEMEGEYTGQFAGPMTFGEIAYLLLNQTLVHLSLHEV